MIGSFTRRVRLRAWLERRWISIPNRTSAAALLQLHSAPFRPPVLDLGCGTGQFTVALASRGCRLVAFELIPERMQWLHEITAEYADLLDIALVSGNGLSLPFKDAAFGTLICNSVLEHIEDDRRAVREMARVLQDRGAMLIAVPNSECRFGYHGALFWRLLWCMPAFLKRIIGSPTLLHNDSPPEAAQTIDVWYQHLHMYTPDGVREILKPYFAVAQVRSYMRPVGGFIHDLTLISKPFVKRIVVAVLPIVIFLDQHIGQRSPGKGFAIIAIRTPRALDA